MSVNQEFLVYLVQLGGHPGMEVKPSPEGADWEKVCEWAGLQGVLAVAWDGYARLYEAGMVTVDMDRQVKKQWIARIFASYERKYGQYRSVIGHLAGFYRKHGLRMMVLKGYGLSLNYPVPNHRPCGDIDIWNFGDYKRGDRLLQEELGIRVDDSHHHHTVFRFEGQLVENHYDFVNVHYGHRNAELEMVFKSLAEKDTEPVEIDGEVIYLPSPRFNALFLLRHMMLHFASTEMSVRQLLDWGFFVQKYSAAVDWEWLQEILRRFHMDGFFRCVKAICVEDLGFDAAAFPSISADPHLKARVLADTFSPEFSEKAPEGKGFFRRVAFKYRRWKANAWKQDLCYGDNRLWSFLVSVWSHLLKPSMI